MLKRFLFVLLLLGFVISVPYEVSAAPKKETRKERRERLKREREEKRKQRQQKNTQQSKHPQKKKRSSKQDTKSAKQPQPKKIIPTLEEKLTPAQVERKIQTIRRRIETAPEDRIPAKYKAVLLDVFDDMAQTQMGRYIFEKAHPDLNFKIEQMPSGYNGVYGSGDHCITFAHRVFEDIQKAKTPEQKLYQKLYIAHVTAHEATHSIQFMNNMIDNRNMSFEEIVTINKLSELHSILNETIVRYQIGNLPKHLHLMPSSHKRCRENIPGKTNLVPMHLFFRELKEAKTATGVDEKTAERFARTKFVESFWQHKGKTPIQIGSRTVSPTTSNVSEVFDTWNGTYNIFEFKNLPHDQIPYQKAMTDIGITKNIQRFVNVMGIDTPTSFFRNPKTTAFNIPFSKRLISYMDGIKDLEIDSLTTGFIKKVYDQGRLYYIEINTTKKQEAQKDGLRTEFYDGNRTKRANYTYKNGKMKGLYREYDKQGRQTMEMPVVDDIPHGDGWILENGTRSRKSFSNRMVSKSRTR